MTIIIYIIQQGEVELALNQKFYPYRLGCIMFKSTLLLGEKSQYDFVNDNNDFFARYTDHGTNVMEITYHFLVEFRVHSMGWNPCLILLK